jgi:hypothetical protein
MTNNDAILTKIDKYALAGFGVVFIILNVFLFAFGIQPFNLAGFGTILAAGFTLFIYSFLYKDNPYYKIAEHLYIGVGLGWGLLLTWYRVLWPEILRPLGLAIYDLFGWIVHGIAGYEGSYLPDYTYDLLEVEKMGWTISGNLFLFIPFIFGLMMYTIYSKKLRWVARYPISLTVGFGTGFGMPMAISARLFTQSEASIRKMFQELTAAGNEYQSVVGSLFSSTGLLSKADAGIRQIIHDLAFTRLILPDAIYDSVNQAIVIIVILVVLIYFFFSVEHKGPLKYTAQFGIISIMIAFGATFGYTIMARLSLLVERIQYLVGDWLQAM